MAENILDGWAALSVTNLRDARRTRREILRHLWLRGHLSVEGSSSPKQMVQLATAAQGARLVGEIGFNCGLSSHAFLGVGTRLVSFDLGEHRYTQAAKTLIDQKFPGRHTLIYGDSRETVPEFAHQNPDLRFDLVFIDGGHDYHIARADIINMKPLCTDRTVVIMDDLVPRMSYGIGPTRAWTEAIEEGSVRHDELFGDGRKRAWAVGRYL